MYIIPLILKATANILKNRAPDELSVDVWVRQQTPLREAIAQAKSKAPENSRVDDEWLNRRRQAADRPPAAERELR